LKVGTKKLSLQVRIDFFIIEKRKVIRKLEKYNKLLVDDPNDLKAIDS
jgi:hypothetical protein